MQLHENIARLLPRKLPRSHASGKIKTKRAKTLRMRAPVRSLRMKLEPRNLAATQRISAGTAALDFPTKTFVTVLRSLFENKRISEFTASWVREDRDGPVFSDRVGSALA